MKTGEEVQAEDCSMFKSSTLVNVTREGSQRTEQIIKDTKGTRERSTEAAWMLTRLKRVLIRCDL